MIQLQADVLLDAQARLGEGPRWDAESESLLWVDVDAALVHATAENGADRTYPVGAKVGCLAPRRGGGAIVALENGFAALDRRSGEVTQLRPVDTPDDIIFNDGACDPAGRFWAGTCALDERPNAGKLYRLDAQLDLHEMLSPVTMSNGLGWTADSRTMYYIDSEKQTVDAFDFDPDQGNISARRTVIEILPGDGIPDGLTVDDEDAIWVALFNGGQVRRYSPGGELLAVVHVAADSVTSCAFGGSDRATLFITTSADYLDPERRAEQPHAGALFAARPGVAGPPATPFAG